jgi:hypothetical protein
MKTPMQELIESLQSINERYQLKGDANWLMNEVLDLVENSLEKEKKQIIDACWYGHDIKHEYFNPIHYFERTYNQNK